VQLARAWEGVVGRCVGFADRAGGVELVGDPAQLGAVGAGGAFGMLVGDRQSPPELSEARRFTEEWERAASAQLRAGSPVGFVNSTWPHRDRLIWPHQWDTFAKSLVPDGHFGWSPRKLNRLCGLGPPFRFQVSSLVSAGGFVGVVGRRLVKGRRSRGQAPVPGRPSTSRGRALRQPQLRWASRCAAGLGALWRSARRVELATTPFQ
jgi:hypothetical protein